jgi:hypothetical protein
MVIKEVLGLTQEGGIRLINLFFLIKYTLRIIIITVVAKNERSQLCQDKRKA